MRKRYCDKCNKEIPVKTSYVSCRVVTWENNWLKEQKVGDLCLNCWEVKNEK
jgi:hypothetical protein